MEYYTGIDLHANNNYVEIIDGRGSSVARKRLPNQPAMVQAFLEPYRSEMQGIVVESTFNWYWLVDALKDNGYNVHLANTTAIQKYNGMKHSDDRDDAIWLAEMLRLNILPTGYVYPKEERPIRDLLRKRGHLVRLRTSLILSLQNIVERNSGMRVKVKDIKVRKEDRLSVYFQDSDDDLAIVGRVSKEIIDALSIRILELEKHIEGKMQLREAYKYLLTIPGIGMILGLTIMLETGNIARFAKVGNYVSYCRKVSSKWTSNDKKKGKGNKKNGNKYLAWAFSEAAQFAIRHNEKARAYYNRKKQKTNFMVAHNALAHKLARAAYHIMKDRVPFMPEMMFSS